MRQGSWLVIAAASCGLLAASACTQSSGQTAGPSYPMYSSPQMPAASGSISASTDANGNTALTIHVHHLAAPARIAPNSTTYVAWIVPLQGQGPAQPGQTNMPMQNPGAYGANPGQQGLMSGQGPAGDQGMQGQQMQGQPGMEGQPGMQGQPGMEGQPGMQGQQGMQGQAQPGMQGQVTGPQLFAQGLPPNAGQPINVGQIKLGSNMNGTLKVKTPFTQFEVLITPEPDAAITQPTNEPVLVAQVNRG